MGELERPVLTDAIRNAIEEYFPRYPNRRAVVLPAAHIIQEELGYVPPAAVAELSELLEIPAPEIQDALSFYGFFHQDKPIGQFRIWVCRSLSCSARGGEKLLAYLKEKLGIEPGETTPDGRFTLEIAECLGACDYAPAILINDQIHKNMTEERIDQLLASLGK
ncbi:MAG: NAD(P)H-dependent oxidoreductase subunit E [Planctomycetota bacterium]|nr:MAG: NAD(P)H-dependent oxidoreductase subunit E [Planctomycetota bacterium]